MSLRPLVALGTFIVSGAVQDDVNGSKSKRSACDYAFDTIPEGGRWELHMEKCARCEGVTSKKSTTKTDLAQCLRDAGSTAYVSWDPKKKACQATDTCAPIEDTSDWWYPDPWRIYFQRPEKPLSDHSGQFGHFDANWDKAGQYSDFVLQADTEGNAEKCEAYQKCNKNGLCRGDDSAPKCCKEVKDACNCAPTKQTREVMHTIPGGSSLRWSDRWPSSWNAGNKGYEVAYATEYCGDIHWTGVTQHCLLVLELKNPNKHLDRWFMLEQEGYYCGTTEWTGCRHVYPSNGKADCPAVLNMEQIETSDDIANLYGAYLYDKLNRQEMQEQLGKELVKISSMKKKFQDACGNSTCYLKVNHERKKVTGGISMVGIRKWTATFANAHPNYGIVTTNCQKYATDMYNELTQSNGSYKNGILMAMGQGVGM